MRKIHIIHMLICFIYFKNFESGILVSGNSTVWEDTYGCDKQYRCSLVCYLMTLLSSSWGIIMDIAIYLPAHGKNIVDEINATEKLYCRNRWNLLVN